LRTCLLDIIDKEPGCRSVQEHIVEVILPKDLEPISIWESGLREPRLIHQWHQAQPVANEGLHPIELWRTRASPADAFELHL